VEQFRYLGTTLTNENYIQEEIKSRVTSESASYHSVQNLLFSSLLSKNIKGLGWSDTILPVVLYACETWSLTFRAQRRLRMVENRVGRKKYESKREGVTGEWRILYNEELRHLYSGNQIKQTGWACSTNGEIRGSYRLLVVKPEGKRLLG